MNRILIVILFGYFQIISSLVVPYSFGALEDEADAYVVVGPRDSSGIPKFMDTQWKPEEFMKEYESWSKE